MTFRPDLEGARDDRSFVQVRRSRGELVIDGFVLAVGERVVLLQQFRDFAPDGWTLLRIDDIVGIEIARDFWQRVLRAEDLGPHPLPLPIDGPLTFTSALRAAGGRGRLAIVECEAENDEDDFLLAQVLTVDDLRARLRPVSMEGTWFTVETIVMTTVTRVQLETPYALMYAKHGEPPPAEKAE